MLEKNNKKLIRAWAMFDWSNSVYSLIITTAIFPMYYSSVVKAFHNGEMIPFFGLTIKSSALYSYSLSFSFLVIVFLSPILSGIADFSGKKKMFMKFFTYLGSISCMGLYFFDGSNVEYGLMCSVLASIGFAGSLVFYNGFLPEVATQDKMDKVSAFGFSLGYIGSVILLIVNLIIYTYPESFGFSSALQATKFGFILVGIWWAGFAQIPFKYLQDKPTGAPFNKHLFLAGFREINKVLLSLKDNKVTSRFLFSFFFFSMGVQTVIYLAGLFGSDELEMPETGLIILVLIIQLVAIAGAYLFAFISKKRGNGFSISVALIIWIVVCVVGSQVESLNTFYLLGALLGLVMGGIQSVSRSTFSKLIPKDTKDTASFFSFYDVTEKLAIVIGTFAFARIDQITGSMRYSLLSMSVLFLAGLIILQTAKLKKNMV